MGRKRINMVGEVYGRLEVEAYSGVDKSGNSLWSCRCECGTLKLVSRGNLTTGRISSCGCSRGGSPRDRREQHLLGRKFGNLTVLAKGHSVGYRDFWLCRCDCGKKLDIRDDHIKTRHDCGCLKEQEFPQPEA